MNDGELKDNFIAIAIQIDENGIGEHSGLIIGVENTYTLFHYTGEDIQFNTTPLTNQWVFCKELTVIDQDFSLDFLAHCEEIQEKSNPTYGFLFENSYWKDGKYFSEASISEITTCVGFCLSVISGYIWHSDYYFNLSDWNFDSTSGFRAMYGGFFDRKLVELKTKYPDQFNHLVVNHMKRITPSELTASGYLSEVPIRKTEIDSIINNITTAVKNKRI